MSVESYSRVCLIWFSMHCYVIGLKPRAHFLIQSEVKPEPIVTRSEHFFLRFVPARVYGWRFDWSFGLSMPFVIGPTEITLV